MAYSMDLRVRVAAAAAVYGKAEVAGASRWGMRVKRLVKLAEAGALDPRSSLGRPRLLDVTAEAKLLYSLKPIRMPP